ncbi:hypothetical protein HYV81_01280 [Candidatus Woesearchaeota archaeon]|nr:hypothetical protein [Candidatus Woesearchaeota archaeon]
MSKIKRNKALEALDKLAGTFKDDTEWDEILKENRKMWKAWGKRLEKESKEWHI